jgi:hypothetical protein
MVTAQIFDHTARKRSFEILAQESGHKNQGTGISEA